MSPSIHVRRRLGVAVVAAMLAVGTPLLIDTAPVDAIEFASGGFVTSARVGRASATVGDTVAVTASVKSNATRRALIDVEIYDRSGRKVFQKYWDNRSLTAGRTHQLTTNWATAGRSAGPYTVKVGVFGTGWSSLIHWNEQAGAVTLTTVAPTTTAPTSTTVAPTTTAPATTTTTVVPTTTAPPTSTSTTTTSPPVQGRFVTLGVGAVLPSGAECAARVRDVGEIRPENAVENNRRGSRANANTRSDWSKFARVDGDFVGSTDEIIQWAACKWGIDEDIARAQVIKESYWYQSSNGDAGESWGLGQVRDTAHQSAFQYSVNARTSSAYNLDYTYASWRACYEGVYTWLNNV